MKTSLRYTCYVAVSLLVGWLSSIGESDLLCVLSGSLFQLLITVVVLYVTLSNLVYGRIAALNSKHDIDISRGIKALKRNIIMMFAIIGADFVAFICLNLIPVAIYIGVKSNDQLIYKQIIINAITFFSLFYFLYVIYDSAMAYFNLLRFHTSSQ